MPDKDELQKKYSRKPWLKWFSRNWLEGSMRFECDPAERGVWVDLCSMANESRNRGVIQANEGVAYPHAWLANKLCVPLELLERCLEKFALQKRIAENGSGITLLKFDWYQETETAPPRGRGRPPKKSPEYREGSYGHLVATSLEDVERITGKIVPEPDTGPEGEKDES